jgi:hypothetical protein
MLHSSGRSLAGFYVHVLSVRKDPGFCGEIHTQEYPHVRAKGMFWVGHQSHMSGAWNTAEISKK